MIDVLLSLKSSQQQQTRRGVLAEACSVEPLVAANARAEMAPYRLGYRRIGAVKHVKKRHLVEADDEVKFSCRGFGNGMSECQVACVIGKGTNRKRYDRDGVQ